MTLSHGRTYLAIPGPSVMPDRVLRAMHAAAPNIYEGELVDVTASIVSDLKRVARTEGHVAIYIANGHGGWEAAANNMVRPGEKVLVLSTGRFAAGWGVTFDRIGAVTEVIDYGLKSPVTLDRVEAALAADTGHEIRAVIMVHVDTATGVRNDPAAVRGVLDRLGHPALLAVDCIASLGVDRFEMDAWGVDIMLAASQKGLMTPPGLAFVFFNDKALARSAETTSYYWDWRPRIAPDAFYEYFAGTAPTHHLLALRAALDMIHEEGIEAVWARHDKLARAAWAAFDAWGQGGSMEINISDPDLRSRAVTALRLADGGAGKLRAWTEEKVGVTLGIGLGMAPPGSPRSGDFFRLGHMGHINGHMLMGVLGVIEAGLVALDIPHGAGALAAAARIIAEA